MAPVFTSTAPSSTPTADSTSTISTPLIVAIVVFAVALVVVIATITLSICLVRRHTRKTHADIESSQDVKVASQSSAGFFARKSSRTAEPELPWPVLQTLPHLRPRRERVVEALAFWRKPKVSQPRPFSLRVAVLTQA